MDCYMAKRYLSQKSIDFINLALGSVSNESWVFVLAKKYNENVAHHFRIRKSNLTQYLQKVEMQPQSNYYISANGFMGGKSRTKNKLYSLNNIVIDIDCHRKLKVPGLLDLRLDHLVHYLLHDALDEYGLLEPSMIVYTGRGLQIWWCHESLSAVSNRKTWERTGQTILQIMQQILLDNKSRDPIESFSSLSVDLSASFSPTGVYRIPDTQNIAANCKATAKIISEHRYTLQELKDFNKIHQKKAARAYFVREYTESCTKWAEKMLSAIQYLRMIRDNDVGEETRNNFCFVYYCMLKSAGFDSERIEAELAMFNSGFKKPMTTRELKSTLSSAERKTYKISSRAMIKILGITKEEEMLLHQRYHFNQIKKKPAVPKSERYEMAVAMYESGKYTIKELSKQTKISEPTLRKIFGQAGISNREEKSRDRYEEIRYLKNQCGMSAPSIAQELGCSVRTVWRALKNQPEIKSEASEEGLFQNAKPCHERKKACNNGYHYGGGASIHSLSTGRLMPSTPSSAHGDTSTGLASCAHLPQALPSACSHTLAPHFALLHPHPTSQALALCNSS